MDYLPNIFKCKVSIIGLGYVGLPLCIELSKNYKCLKTKKNLSRKIIGYDLDESRIKELNVGHDRTNELSTNELINKKDIEFTSDFKKLKESEVFIVTVPTPIDETKRPDLKCLGSACRTIGKVLKERSSTQLDSSKFKNPIIIFESTVYPGATEEYCIPIIEEESELKFNDKELGKGFFS